MNKAIVLLTGSPESKNKFDNIAKQTCWLWNCNARNKLPKAAKELGWNGEKDNNYYTFISGVFELATECFNFEQKHIFELIENFVQDEHETMVDPQGKVFDKFLLVLHGVTRDLTAELKEQCGVFQIHLAATNSNPDIIEKYDLVLFEDDPNFESEINRVLNILTKSTKTTTEETNKTMEEIK